MRPDYAQLTDLPAPASSRLIGFERVEIVVLESFPPQFVLVVSGIKPWLNMEVTLDPLTYVRQPEYWGIEVVGRLPGGIGLPAVAPYKVSLPLAGIIGTKGIEVIGATRTERRDIGEEQPSQPAGTVFELRGADAELTYRATDAPQDRTLSFRDAEHDRSFSGAEIRTQQSELGEQVTVGLLDAPDAPLVKLTLLVPPVNLGQSSETVIETVAIISTHREAAFTPQPPEGQLTTYKSLCLTGTAQRDPVCPPAELTFSRDDRPVDGELREAQDHPGGRLHVLRHAAHGTRGSHQGAGGRAVGSTRVGPDMQHHGCQGDLHSRRPPRRRTAERARRGAERGGYVRCHAANRLLRSNQRHGG